jgi:hypothetical protein
MLLTAAICPAPPLLARELTGLDPVIPELRQACLAATTGLLAGEPDLIGVVGVAAATAAHDPAGRLDPTVFAPALRTTRRAPDGSAGARHPASAATPPLPVPLGLGSRLLDQAGYRGPRELQAVAADAAAAECAATGARLAAAADRVALLVMADGSACRTLKAPGYLDERSTAYDAGVERIIASGELAALLKLDASLAAELMASGRAALQVLAAAAGPLLLASEIRYSDAPFGVGYLVASLVARPGDGTLTIGS